MASIFAIALNDFMQEYTDKEETHQEPTDQPAEVQTAKDDDEGSKGRKRGTRSGQKKLFDLQRVVLKTSSSCETPWQPKII
jgi:hypothetical protein